MKRLPFAIFCSLAPLLICLLWVRCAYTPIIIGWQDSGILGGAPPYRAIIATKGALIFAHGDRDHLRGGLFVGIGTNALRGGEYLHLASSQSPLWRSAGWLAPTGLGLVDRDRESGLTEGVSIPCLYFALAGAAFSAFLMNRQRCRAGRIAKDLCASCGYDLRATPDRCPECGLRRAPFGSEPQGRRQSSRAEAKPHAAVGIER